MKRPTTLSDDPRVVIRLDRTSCRRCGRSSFARLAARYRPEQSLDGVDGRLLAAEVRDGAGRVQCDVRGVAVLSGSAGRP